jgi:Cytochrome P460
MKRILFVLFVVVMVAVVIGLTTLASEPADEGGTPIYLTETPEGYRDLRLISVSRLTAGNGSSQLRAQLGNDLAIKAYREGKIPFPDGAIIAALHWNEVSSEDNNQVLAKGFPGAGIQSFVPGSGLNMQFMVKDSKKYAATAAGDSVTLPTANPGTRS